LGITISIKKCVSKATQINELERVEKQCYKVNIILCVYIWVVLYKKVL